MRKLWVLVAAFAAILALPAVPSFADEALFEPLAHSPGKALRLDPSFQALNDDASTAAIWLVRANAQAVNEKAATLTIPVEPGLELRAIQTESYVAKSGALVWSGVIENPGATFVPFSPKSLEFDAANSVTLVRNGDRVTGNLHFNAQWYKIRPLKSGGHAIVAVDSNALRPDHPEEYADLPTIDMARRAPRMNKVDTVITVLVNYTPAAAAASGDINGLIDLAVAETNQGYVNSDVLVDLVLAGKALTTYTESSFSTDLARYRTPGDGFMDDIHALRDTTGADVAVLLVNSTAYCGLASSIGSNAATAFASVYWDCATGYYSFGHEIGHLQSARHDPRNDPSTTPYAWGHGYQYTKRPSWRTIMAYDCTGGCPRLNYWSNPNKLYNNKPMGTATKNDNARVLNDTRATLAAFR